jgi:predicted HicB family RNase H-like nuclease
MGWSWLTSDLSLVFPTDPLSQAFLESFWGNPALATHSMFAEYDVVKDLADNGENVPEPLASKKYSGKFQVRVTADTHRALAIKAAERNVSLNRLVSESLASSC